MKFKETQDLLKNIKTIYEKLYENGEKESVAARDLQEDINALERAIRILREEEGLDLDSKAHSDVTVETEEGREITLAEWSRRNGIDPSTARHKAIKGGFDTARKVGGVWLINENEKNVDKRRKKIDKNKILQELLFKKTGRVFSGSSIWEEIERAAGEAEEGSQWITGQDDILEKWDYYVKIKRAYDKDFDQWETDISLEEIKITDKKTGNATYVQVNGAEL